MTRRLPDGRIYHRHTRRGAPDYWHAHHMANGDRSTYRHPLSHERAHPISARPYPVRERPVVRPFPLDPDPREVEHEPVPRQFVDRPRFPLLTWILVLAVIASVAFLIATRVPDRAAPRSAPDSTAPLPGASGTDVVSDGAVLAQVQVSASGPRPSGAPLERSTVVESGPTRDDGGAPPSPATLDPRVGREGVITHMGRGGWPIDYLAIPLGPGRLVRICGPAACRDMVSTDAGPNRERILAGVIADVSWQRFETLCGVPARMGRCNGSWTVMTSSTANVTPPPTDAGP